MSWNGAGVFNRLYSWVADAAAGIDISSSRMDQDTDDITSNGFGNTLTRDGQGQPTANLPMAGFRHTGVQNAVNRTDYAALGQVQDSIGLNWTIAGGTSDAITATYTPAITALVDGQLCFFRATAANATATPTFSPNGLTPHTIVRGGGGPLQITDIKGGSHYEVILRYNLANTEWEMLNPALVPGVISRGTLSAGTANALTLGDAIFSSQDGYQLQFIAGNSNTGAATLAVSGGTAEPIVKDTAAGPIALTGGEITAGNSVDLVWDNTGTQWHIVNPVLSTGSLQLLNSAMGMNMPVNMGLTASVGSNLLTVALKTAAGADPSASSPIWIPFQTISSANATGAPTWVEVTSALSIDTHATGASLGSSNATPFRFWIVAFNNAGTVVLALINCSIATQIFPLVEGLAQSTTAMTSGATSAGVFYTENGTALTSCAFRILGYLDYDSGLTTAGTYTGVPSRVVMRTPAMKLPGDIIQLIYFQTNSSQSASGSFVASNVTASITPTSKVNLVDIDLTAGANAASGANMTGEIRRGTTTVISEAINLGSSSAVLVNGMFSFNIVDAPDSTSSTAYTLYFNSSTGTSSIPSGHIRLKEIMG